MQYSQVTSDRNHIFQDKYRPAIKTCITYLKIYIINISDFLKNSKNLQAFIANSSVYCTSS